MLRNCFVKNIPSRNQCPVKHWRLNFLLKVVNYFCKKLKFGFFTGFWIRLWERKTYDYRLILCHWHILTVYEIGKRWRPEETLAFDIRAQATIFRANMKNTRPHIFQNKSHHKNIPNSVAVQKYVAQYYAQPYIFFSNNFQSAKISHSNFLLFDLFLCT